MEGVVEKALIAGVVLCAVSIPAFADDGIKGCLLAVASQQSKPH